MKVIISGGSGLVATELTHKLLQQTDFKICLLSRSPLVLIDRYKDFADRIECLANDMLDDIILDVETVVVHTAFARSSKEDDIDASLSFTSDLAQWTKENKIRKFINISSQSVYGNNYESYITENGMCNPEYPYAKGKYDSEKKCNEIFNDSKTTLITIRLSSVCENARFIKVFVKNALEGQPIRLTAPNQIVSFIDVRDVAEALYRVIDNHTQTSSVYNLGSGKTYTIGKIAEMVKEIGVKEYELDDVEIQIEDSGNRNKIGMSIQKFSTKFNWNPSYTMQDMIESIFNMLTNVNRGGGIRYPSGWCIAYEPDNSSNEIRLEACRRDSQGG